jgi:glycosyltransferase involved in cell wall biosynthesis
MTEHRERDDGAPLAMAIVGPLPPPSGGMANQTAQLARLLGEAGLQVEVSQVNPPYRPAWLSRVRGVRAIGRLLPYLARLWSLAGRVQLIHVMANSGWAWHLFAAPAVWIARLRGTPVVVNYRGGEAEAFMTRQARWILPTLRSAAVVAVPSRFLQAVFARWGVATAIVPNIVDLSRFAPAAAVPGRLQLLVARNLEDIYDIPTAIAAFAIVHARHRHARLTVAGSGPRSAELEAQARALGIADLVTFTGRVDNDRMAELYRASDILLNASLVDNMPISLLEAMASGVPVVSTSVGGIPFLVEHEVSALLVAPGDPGAMAAAALRLVDDPGLRERLREAALEAARACSWSHVMPVLLRVYEGALGHPLPHARTAA